MPVDSSQPVYSPNANTDINQTWGQGVSESVLQRFTSAADRDAKWTSPPANAMCFHDDVPWIYNAGQGGWRPALIQQFSKQVIWPGARSGSGLDIMLKDAWPLMPKASYDAMYLVQCEGFGGYSYGGTGGFGFYLYDNSTPAPTGAGWFSQAWGWGGLTYNNAPNATWVQLGSTQMVARVSAGEQPTTVLRIGWNNGANMWMLIRITWTLFPFVAPTRYKVFTMGTHAQDRLSSKFVMGGTT